MSEEWKWQLTDIAIAQNYNIVSKENEKVNKHINLVSAFNLKQKLLR